MNLVSIIIVCIIFFIGIMLVIWGISFKYKSYHLMKKCKNKCRGILKEIDEIEIDHSNLLEGKLHTTKSYVPTYEYEVQGKIYKIKGTNGSGFKIGDIVEINYNSENPEECYIEGYSFILWIVLLIIGIIFLIVALGFVFLIKLVF